jgi:hypothetical protein
LASSEPHAVEMETEEKKKSEGDVQDFVEGGVQEVDANQEEDS